MVGAGLGYRYLRPPPDIPDPEPCYVQAQLASTDGGAPPGLTLRVSGGGITKDFSVGGGGTANLDIDPEQVAAWEIAVIDRDGRTLNSVTMDGCPDTQRTYPLNESIQLQLGPR